MSKKLFVIIIGIVLIVIGTLFGKDYILPKANVKAEIRVNSYPTSSIFLNGELLGTTPYKSKFNPGEYELKLVPEESETTTWQKTITLNKGVQTFINVNLGDSQVTSSWEVLTLEKIKRGKTEISVSSPTDSSEVFFDNEKKGTTPLSFPNVKTGNHEIKLTAPGFLEKIIKVKITPGYKLNIKAQLILIKEKQSNPETLEKKEKTYIIIKDTPTGWLRVREKASRGSKEITKVKPKEKYLFLDEKNSWYKIEYEEGKEGWISGKYAEKIE